MRLKNILDQVGHNLVLIILFFGVKDLFTFSFGLGHHQGARDTPEGTDEWAKFCGSSVWLEFGCFLGTSLLHLRDMGKLLPSEWYDAEVEDDSIARSTTPTNMHASPFHFSYLPFFRELYDTHQAAMAVDFENRKRHN